MGLFGFYVRKLMALLKGEVLVLPSRTHRLGLFVLVLLVLPLISRDPYVIRIVVLTSIFAILARQLGPFVRRSPVR